MRILTASTVIGSLILTGSLPAAAGQVAVALNSKALVRVAANSNSAADRNSYTQKAREEMQVWQQRLHDFSEKSAAKGEEAGYAAEKDLNKAWTKAETASRKLRTAGAEGWDSAKMSFEKASRELADAWGKIRGQDK
jgi:hypothetical protein